jgi:hypothetical protein
VAGSWQIGVWAVAARVSKDYSRRADGDRAMPEHPTRADFTPDFCGCAGLRGVRAMEDTFVGLVSLQTFASPRRVAGA